jgi:hypothetical protein
MTGEELKRLDGVAEDLEFHGYEYAANDMRALIAEVRLLQVRIQYAKWNETDEFGITRCPCGKQISATAGPKP